MCRSGPWGPGEMELDPVQQGVISDRAGVRGPPAQCFPVLLPGPADVVGGDGRERHQLHARHLDLRGADRVPAALLDLGTAPQPERHRDVARHHRVAQFPAELHRPMLRRPAWKVLAALAHGWDLLPGRPYARREKSPGAGTWPGTVN